MKTPKPLTNYQVEHLNQVINTSNNMAHVALAKEFLKNGHSNLFYKCFKKAK